jgi:benzoyl-CoA reductase subunit B
MLADWHLSKPEYQYFYHPENKTKMMDAIARNWKVGGIILHYNRGCEGLSCGSAENRVSIFLESLGLKKPVSVGMSR